MSWTEGGPLDPDLIAMKLSIHWGLTRSKARRVAIAREYKRITGEDVVQEEDVVTAPPVLEGGKWNPEWRKQQDAYNAIPVFNFRGYDQMVLKALDNLADAVMAMHTRSDTGGHHTYPTSRSS